MSENEIAVVEDTTAPSLTNQFDIVDIEYAAAAQKNFNDLVEALLDKSDYQTIQGVPKKKKSAWRKLARAFNISDDIVEKSIIREEDHQIISAWFVVKATLPNGRYGIGIGDCSIFDKINKKDTEMPSNFELRKRFNNAEHDVLTTAHTRAKSRAFSDLVGGGEVSAEELSGTGAKPNKPVKPKASKPKVPNSSNLGNKAKTPKAPKAPSKPKEDDDAVEVNYEVHDMSSEKQSMSLKDIINSNTNIRAAVDELQAQGTTANRDNIKDKLLDLLDMGKITSDDYKKAKELLE